MFHQFPMCDDTTECNREPKGGISTQTMTTNSYGSEETKECGEPLQVADVEQHDGFLKIKRIVACMFKESDNLAALCNVSLNRGESTRIESLTEGQHRLIRLVCNILMHSDLVPRQVYIALSTFSEGYVTSRVGVCTRPLEGQGLHSEALHSLVRLTPSIIRVLCDWGGGGSN